MPAFHIPGGGGGGGTWGEITGTLSNQTDLQNALNAKLGTSKFVSYKGVSNTFTFEGWTAVPFTTVVSDADSVYNTSNGQLTVPASWNGRVAELYAYIWGDFESYSVGVAFNASVWKNGVFAGYIDATEVQRTATQEPRCKGLWRDTVATGDVLTIRVYNGQGVRHLRSDDTQYNFFHVRVIG